MTQGLRHLHLAAVIETGTVQINGPPARGPDHFPFMGVKDSGIGSQGVPNSIKSMSNVKSVVLNLPKASFASACDSALGSSTFATAT